MRLAAVLGIALAGLGATDAGGVRAEPLGVLVGGERLPVIDMHIHVGQWKLIPPRAQRRNLERVPAPMRPFAGYMMGRMITGEGIVGELDEAGIAIGVLFASYFPHTSGIATNEYVAEQVQVAPQRLLALASLRVDQWNVDGPRQLAALERAIREQGMIGIKLAPAHAQTRLDDERLHPIYALAARLSKPLYIHTGTSPFPGTRPEQPYANASYLEPAIRAHPGAVFILGHAGYDTRNLTLGYIDECIRLAKSYPNVYIEPSALGSPRAGPLTVQAMRKLREAGLAGRTIYGSDGPQRSGYLRAHLERTVTAMQETGYGIEEMRGVLAGNFLRVFGLSPEVLEKAK